MSRVGNSDWLVTRSLATNGLITVLSPLMEMCSRPVILIRVFSPLPMIFSSVRGSFTGMVRLMRFVSCAFLPPPEMSSASVRVRTEPTACRRSMARSISSTKTSTTGSSKGRGGYQVNPPGNGSGPGSRLKNVGCSIWVTTPRGPLYSTRLCRRSRSTLARCRQWRRTDV